jgi:hypothetical protein
MEQIAMVLPGLPGGDDYHAKSSPASPEAVYTDDVLLAPDEQGIILPQEFSEAGGTSQFKNHVDPQLLRYGLAFWDRVAIVQLTGVLAFGPPEVESALELAEQGYLSLVQSFARSVVVGGAIFEPSIAAVAYALEEANPGQWCLGREISNEPIFSEPNKQHLQLNFELVNAIAVPHISAPIHEVLEFKGRRQSELQALRSELAETRRRISSADNMADVKGVELERLDRALRDHMRVSREWHFPVVLTNQKMKLSWRTFTAAAGLASGAVQFDLPSLATVLGGFVGAVGGTFEAEIAMRKPVERGRAFEYAAAFHKTFTT